MITKKINLVLLLSFFLLFTSCFEYEDVDIVNIGDYTIDKATKEYVDLAVNVEVNNPNGYNIRLKKTKLDLFVEGDKVGKASVLKDIVLKKKTQQQYKLVIRADIKELSNSLMSKIPSLLGKQSVKVGLKGKVKAKAYGIIGKKFDFDVEERINIGELMKLVK